MKLIDIHDSVCYGLRLLRVGRYSIQLWYCPTGYQITKHNHPNQHIELMFLFGDTTFYKISKGIERCKRVLGFSPRCFTIRPDEIHWASRCNKPLIFINFAKAIKGSKPLPASVDFNPVEHELTH